MNANETGDPYVDRSYNEVKSALRLSESRLGRLLDDAFMEGETRRPSIVRLIEDYGADRAIAVMQGARGLAERLYYFGPGRMLAGRDKVDAALRQLPDAINAHHELHVHKLDLDRARDNLLREQHAERTGDFQRTKRPQRPSGRDRERDR